MAPATWRQIEALLDRVLDLEEPDRTRYINEHIDDEALKAEIRSLLQAELNAPAWIDTGVDGLFGTRGHIHEIADSVRDQPIEIDRYQIVKEIGRGGMSVVYQAQRTDGEFDQEVAIKIMQPFGIDREDRFRRLRAERQILANLNHPGIAKVFDGGVTPEGWPYMVMELVDGLPVTQYCREKNLDLDARMGLFLKICDAVIYAHRNLVVHRDLKPSNILVSGNGQVKLLDFGIAKLLEEDQNTVPLTRTGHRFMTPEYAAPEQFRGEIITTSADLYSLGVLLYELLAGVKPYDLTGKSMVEIERLVCEETPPKPSARQKASSLPPDKLRGDLDVICMKALRKEADDRYGSVRDLQEDIQLHLRGLPVTARPATTAYRIRKFVQRNRTGVALATVLILILAGFIAALIHQQSITLQERDRAQLEVTKAQEVTDFMLGLFEANDPMETRGDTLTVRALLDRGVERAARLGVQPEVHAEMLQVMGRVYQSLILYDVADSLLTQALLAKKETYGEKHPEVARSMTALAQVKAALDRRETADSLYHNALAAQQDLLGNEHLDIAETLGLLSSNRLNMRRDTTDIQTAEERLLEALTIRRTIQGNKHPDIAKDLLRLAAIMHYKQDRDHAERFMHEALEMQEELLDKHHPDVLNTKSRIATYLYNAGRYREAEEQQREILAARRFIFGESDPRTAQIMNNLALSVSAQGDFDTAANLYDEVIAIYSHAFDENSSYLSPVLNHASQIYMNKGDFEQAEILQRRALEINLEHLGPDSPATGASYYYLSLSTRRQGKLEEAETWAQKSLVINRRLGDDLYTAWDLFQLAFIEKERQNYLQAETLFKEGIKLQAKVIPDDHHHTATSLNSLASLYIDLKRYDDAEPLLRKSLEIRTEKLGENDVQTTATKTLLATSLAANKKFEEAEILLAEINNTFSDDPTDKKYKEVLQHFIELYEAWGKPGKAAEYQALLAAVQ